MRHCHARSRSGDAVVGLFILAAIGFIAWHPWVLAVIAVLVAAYVAVRKWHR